MHCAKYFNCLADLVHSGLSCHNLRIAISNVGYFKLFELSAHCFLYKAIISDMIRSKHV